MITITPTHRPGFYSSAIRPDRLSAMRLSSPGGLTVDIEPDGSVRIGVDGGDWFGPGRCDRPGTPGEVAQVIDDLGHAAEVLVADGDIGCSVRTYPDRGLAVFAIEAMRDLDGLRTGAFERPSVGWPVFTPSQRRNDDTVDGLRSLTFQHCEFALPSTAGADLDGFFLLPTRPPTGWPLLVSDRRRRTLMLAPLDHFHEQVIGLNDGAVRAGWHGDLDRVPAGFRTNLGLFVGGSPRECVDTWGSLLLERSRTVRPGRWADALARRPSYWTDNGAAYWYRTEPGHDAAGSIVAAVDDLRGSGVPIGAVQLDSWFYPHVETRPFDTDEWVVPPSAMLAWEPRADVLPDGIANLRSRLGDPPLVAHIRHLSSAAPIAAEVPVLVDGPYAVPATSAGYQRWLDQCVTWGVETFEHDWLVEVFLGVRGLRETPGRARAWQEGIDRAARERGITLQWCMGTPADLAQTTTLTQVTSVRTCGDHGYIATAGQLWAWFCITNTLARALGLMPYKDVFRTDPEVAGSNGEVEALLSALSTGPVGLGDRVGRFDIDLVVKLCRSDGILVKPDVPVAATSTSMLDNPAFNPAILVAECHTDHPAGRWAYVTAMHCLPEDRPLSGHVELCELDDAAPAGDVVAWNWRERTATRLTPDTRIPVSLAREDWTYFVLAPLIDGRIAVIGDVGKFVTAGDARLRVEPVERGARVVVLGADEDVTVTGWSDTAPRSDTHTVRHDSGTGIWEVTVTVPPRGWTEFQVAVDRKG